MAPLQRENCTASMASTGPSFREPRRSEPAPRCAPRGSAGLRGGAYSGAENNGPPVHSRTAWGRSSPLNSGSQMHRSTTALVARKVAPDGGRKTQVFRDITNVTATQRNAGKIQKSSQSARALMPQAAKEPLPMAAVVINASAPLASQPPTTLATLEVDSAPSPARPEDLEPFPCEEGSEVQRCAEYAPDIFEQLFQDEASVQPKPNYMEVQKDINGKMRAILVDWLVEVHMKYRLRQPVLFLTVNLLDRYLSLSPPISRKKLQLVGVVAMFVAAKFEEIDPPTVHNFVYITDNAYTKEEVLQAECAMLATLGFNIVTPTADEFLDRLLRAHCCDSRHRSLAHYLLELAMVDIKWLRYRPSHVAAAAVLLSNELLGQRTSWPPSLARCARYSETALRPCVSELRAILEGASKSTLQAVRKKFQQREYHAVSTLAGVA
eukprot:gb/GFBE01036023.1/.p1 GENE.gb/GFBE01036023.1/~~gb/GFBE01036023.1/.p1  ORF type:complete len:437 (+),score=78.60 gb/GFBE01036023.1/:1-1311(+)